ncbi:MAG: energy transducer TonB [Candidatus Glassbacteria bacterium]|nr:energy transducer TonB [Candidatus Glassbacteria bacterium]
MEAKQKNKPSLLGRLSGELERRVAHLMLRLQPLSDFMAQAADRDYYDFFYRRSTFIAFILLILAFPVSELFKDPPIIDTDPYGFQNRQISDNTLIVINAVPRTSLAQKRVKVPIIREVAFALEEIDMPKPEFGAIEIGPEQKTEVGREGTGRLPYRRPELLMLVPPVYPKDAEKKGIEGTVSLRVLVTVKGTVDKVEVESSSGHRQMDEAAVKAARKTRFRPAIKDGQRVAMWINYPIQFALSRRKND